MEIRSVSVHLDADVAGYIAKMRLAGAETDRAFSSSSRSIDTTNRGLATTESRLSGVDSKAHAVETTFRDVNGRLRTMDGRFAAVNDTVRTTETVLGRTDSAARRVESTFGRMGNDRSGLATAAGKLDHFLGGLGAIPTLALAAGPALIPLTAAAVGLGAALAAPIAFAGGGLTLFGLLGGAAIKQTQTQYKALDTLSKAVATARSTLQSAKASGSSTVAADQIKYNAALKQYHDALKAISPQQRQFHGALETLDSDFGKFIRGPGGQDLLGPFTQGLKIADDLLPHAQPIIHAVAGSLDELLGELDKYAQTPGFDRFVHAVAGQAGHDIKAFGHIIGDVTPGLGRLFLILDRRLSPEVLHEVDHLAQGFSDWAKSKGARQDVEGFIRYLHETGPDVAHAVEGIARGTAHLVHALAPLGPGVLHVIQGIGDALSAIPPDTLTELAKAGTGLLVFQKLGGLKLAKFAFGGPGSPLGGLPGLGGGGLPGVGRGVTPVYVTNFPPSLGGPGGPGVVGAPGTAPKGGGFAAAEEDAIKAAKAAAEEMKAAGGDVAAQSSAAGRAFKEAMAAAETVPVLDFAIRGGLKGLLRTIVGGPIISSQETAGTAFSKSESASIFAQDFRGAKTMPSADTLKAFGVTAAQARNLLHLPEMKAANNEWVAYNAHAQQASRELDQIGPHAAHSFGTASKTVDNFNHRVADIKGGPASAQMDLINHSAQRSFSAAGHSADQLQHKVSGLHGPKPLKVDADTSSADHKIHATDASLSNLSRHRATPTVTADTSQADAALRRVYAELAGIRSKTITVTTQHVTGGSVKMGNAAGGHITGPGGPTDDQIPAWLSNGEYVVRAAMVNRYGLGLMHAINAGAYANGGPVATTHVTRTVGGQPVDPVTAHLNDELHKMQHNLAGVNKELQDEQQHRQNLMQAEKQLESTVASNFRSQLFGVTPATGIWGAGATSDPRSILRGDIRDARAYTRDIRRLRGRGLRGGALAEVTTLADAEQALGLPRGELRDISRLYQIRQRASQAAGAVAGDLRYGKQLAAANAQLQHIHAEIKRGNAELHHLRAEQHQHAKTVGQEAAKGVNNGVRSGVQRGSKP